MCVHTCIVSLFTSPSPFSRLCPCCSCTVTSRPTSPTHPSARSCRNFPTPKRGSSALRTRTSSLATWPSPYSSQVMCPRSATRSLPWTMTRRPSTIRTTVSLTSRKPKARTLDNSVFPQCLNPQFCTFLTGEFVLQRESKESMQSGKRCKTERDEREGFVISVAEFMPMKSTVQY